MEGAAPMNDETDRPSGSRWEPGDGDRPQESLAAQASTGPDVPLPSPPDAPATEERRARLRGRAILAGAATALTLGGGLTGFVIGHATAGDSSADLRPADFSNQGPGGRSGDAQRGGPPSFRDGDGDGNGFGPPRGSDDGSSSSDSGTTDSST